LRFAVAPDYSGQYRNTLFSMCSFIIYHSLLLQKMNQKNIRYILIAAVVILGIIFFFLNYYNKGTEFDWSENYREDNKEPYGTYVVHNLLQKQFEGKKFTTIKSHLAEKLPIKKGDDPANYVFIGEGIYLDSADLSTLLTFAENGNNVFISSKSIDNELMEEHLYSYTIACDEMYWEGYTSERDTSSLLNMHHPNLIEEKGTVFKYVEDFKTVPYSWNYIDEMYFCDEDGYEDFLDIGDIDGYSVNFVKVPYGEGNFYLHTTPLAFTNFHMIEEYGLEYADKVFAHLSDGDIYWDAYNHVGDLSNYNDGGGIDDLFNPVSLSEESPLEYILSQDSLRWAWYLLLILAFLYLLFRAKRRQRIIPVKEPNTNTSLEFIETIGRLYFQQNNHLKLEEQKMKLFLNFIRERYHLTTHNVDDAFIEKLTNVSDVNLEKVKSIFALYQSHSKKGEIFEEQLINYHQAMDYFYKNCK
jgi:hypothetical protein